MAVCYECNGKGYVECPKCNGSGEAWPESMSHGVLRDLDRWCDECNGSGTVKCDVCYGTGYDD